jgi:hypothetical protein
MRDHDNSRRRPVRFKAAQQVLTDSLTDYRDSRPALQNYALKRAAIKIRRNYHYTPVLTQNVYQTPTHQGI